MHSDTELLDRLLAPIAGANPSGRDLRYDPRFEAVREARREELDLPGGSLADHEDRKVADWPLVVTLASRLLSTETKDLRLAAWLTEALLNRDGIRGLQPGLATLQGLLERFWETLHPMPDEEGDLGLRAAPLEWVGCRLDVAVRLSPVAVGDLSLLDYQAARTIPTERQANDDVRAREAREHAVSDRKRVPEEVSRGIAATPTSFYTALVDDAVRAREALATLDRVSEDRFGSDAPCFRPLARALEDAQRIASSILALRRDADPTRSERGSAVAGDDALGDR